MIILKNFKLLLKDINCIELHKTMSISKKWQSFVEKVSQCSLNHNLIQSLLKEMKKIVLYESMLSEFEQMVDCLKNQLPTVFISDETTLFEGKRNDLFSNLAATFKILKDINNRFKDILPSPIDIDTLEKEIKGKVEKMKTHLSNKASKSELSTKDADDFRMYYNHLVSFENYAKFLGIDIEQVLTDSQDKILAKIYILKKEMTKSIKDPVVVSTVLIKMKFFAENLSMFEKYINDEIDNALKSYKQSEGPANIALLSVELEKTDIGARMISEHSSLSGEDWRKRREKMQKQDDLDYIIKNLTGTDLAKKILCKRYKTFREVYDKLPVYFFENTSTER